MAPLPRVCSFSTVSGQGWLDRHGLESLKAGPFTHLVLVLIVSQGPYPWPLKYGLFQLPHAIVAGFQSQHSKELQGRCIAFLP